MDTSGIITTIAGSGYTISSALSSTLIVSENLNPRSILVTPVAITIDSVGNIYFSDNQNLRIRKIYK